MNESISYKYSKLKPVLFFLPVLLLGALFLFLFAHDALSVEQYVQIQKDAFYAINYTLGQFPRLLLNVTQLGDASIILSFLSVFLIYAPKIWEALLSASLVSVILSIVLKNIFLVPRPPVVFDNSSFIIIGRTAVGHASLPSGHSITVFTTLTVLLFAFMPAKLSYKMLWIFFAIITGLMIAVTRVGVGAHYPLDVITGSIIGYISGLIGIFINRKYPVWNWIGNKKYYPIFLLLMLVCGISIIIKIVNEGLPVYYLALISLFFPFYIMTYAFIKK